MSSGWGSWHPKTLTMIRLGPIRIICISTLEGWTPTTMRRHARSNGRQGRQAESQSSALVGNSKRIYLST
jgi:hypothetical protein